MIQETSGANVVEVHFDSVESDMVAANSFNRITGITNWCDADEQGSGSGNGEDGEDEAVVMVFNGEITVEAGSNPENFVYFYCYDPTATQDC